LAQYFYDFLNDLIHLVRLQMADFVKDYMDIRSEDPIWSDITLSPQTAGLKVVVVELHGIPISGMMTGYLAKNPIIALQLGKDKRRAPFGLG